MSHGYLHLSSLMLSFHMSAQTSLLPCCLFLHDPSISVHASFFGTYLIMRSSEVQTAADFNGTSCSQDMMAQQQLSLASIIFSASKMGNHGCRGRRGGTFVSFVGACSQIRCYFEDYLQQEPSSPLVWMGLRLGGSLSLCHILVLQDR